FVGVGEGVITALVLSSIAAVRPELVAPTNGAPARALWPVVVYGVVVALGLAWFVMPFASEAPDGLEAVAKRLGFEAREQGHGALWSTYTAWAAGVTILFIVAAG